MTPLPLHDRLDAYPLLPPDERAEVAREAAARPEMAERLAEARALAAAVDAARRRDPEMELAEALAAERLGLRTEPVVTADPALQAAAAEMRATLDRIEAEAEDPVAQFERITGTALPPLAEPAAVPATRAPARAADRSAAAPSRRARRATPFVRMAALACAVLGVAYAGLFATSAALTPERARVADLGDVAESYRPVTVRGADALPVAERYEAALALLADARRSTLGLFPRYDAAALDRAADAFAAIQDGETGRFGSESALAVARIRLLQGRDADALAALDGVSPERTAEVARMRQWIAER